MIKTSNASKKEKSYSKIKSNHFNKNQARKTDVTS